MTDRLKQIWTGFANQTSVRLTSADIDTMMRPPTARRAGDENDPAHALSQGHEDESDAVTAAFATLHAEIQAKSNRPRKERGAEAKQSFTADEAMASYAGLDDRLLSDLAFTEARVKRSSVDYLKYAADYHAGEKQRKRKKFLGIF